MRICFLLFIVPSLAQIHPQIFRGSQAESLLLNNKKQMDWDASRGSSRVLAMSSEYGEMHKMKKGSKMSRMMMKAIKPLETSPVDPPSNDQQKPSLPYSNSPHSGETQTMYLDLFSGIVGSAVYTPGTIYYQAAEWIINLDEQTLDINDPTLSQRYLLALF